MSKLLDMLSRHVLASLAGGAALFGLLAVPGCGLRPADNRPEIRYMAWGNPEQLAVEQQIVDAFMRENPGIKVRLFKVPQSAYLNKAIIMLASRTAPDVIRIDHYNFPNLVRKDYFHDLTPLAQKDPGFHAADFFPNALQEGMMDGHLYGLNVLLGGVMMYYNKTLFRNAGLEDPYELSQRGQWTWEKLRSDAIALTKMGKDGRVERFGVQIPVFPHNAFILWAYGAEILSPDGKKCLLDSPEAIHAYQFLADLRWKDHAAPTPSQGALSAFAFESGKLGMTFDWMGMAPRYRKAVKDFDWDICPVPLGPKGGQSILKGNQLVMYRECPHPDAAWKFMRFVTGPETEKRLYGNALRRGDPSRKAVAYSPEFLNSSKPPFNTRAYLSALENGHELPINARWQEWNTALNSELDELWSGRERDAGVVLRRAARKVDEVLAGEEGF